MTERRQNRAGMRPKTAGTRARQTAAPHSRLRTTGTSRRGGADFLFFILTLGLVIFGVIMVFSASYYNSLNNSGNPYTYLLRELFFAVTGFALMMAAALFDYHKYRKAAVPFLLLVIVLLVLVLTPLGIETNGAKRWLGYGAFTIMPGELAKLAAIFFCARFFSEKPDRIVSPVRGILPMLLLGGVMGFLIMQQPNMSTAITVIGIILVIMFVAGLHYKYLIGLLVLIFFAALGLIFGDSEGYRRRRVTSFLDPFANPTDDNYQVRQSLEALGSGGLFGLGLGHSVQKTLYLPEPQNDFILAIIGEELGYIGVLVLMVVYVLLIWRGIKIAMEAEDRFGTLLASGIIGMIGLQVVLNVAVVTSSMPPTGVILPFVSYGGNALWICMFAAGVMLNISRSSKKKTVQAPDAAGGTTDRQRRSRLQERRQRSEQR
ncbi:MAG: putative lipid II flippase FtsW [Anaerovoracaceae bacterium]|jgi:cell division protein FtsW